jgi:hypothetical protein
MRLRAGRTITALATTACLAQAGPAGAATVRADRVVDRSCSAAERSGAPGIATERVTASGTSMVSARLTGARGDWNLAVFDAAGALVAASSFAGGDEVAQGFATEAGPLTVQACRIDGADETGDIEIDVDRLTEQAPPLRMVRVATPTAAAEQELLATGLDLTEHGGEGYLDVVLHSPAEGALLDQRGLDYRVLEPDLLERSLADRAAERRTTLRGGGGGMPSGRTGTYRRLFDYSEEMQELAEENPGLVRYFTLPHETYEGRPVEAIEVAPRVRRRDGRPVFALMGAHHAREWPSAEHTIEFAYDLINGWKDGRRPIRRLLRQSRVVLVPVVNPDGFNTSREAGQLAGAAGGRDAPLGEETANLVIPYEYQRKNCRFLPPMEDQGGSCTQLPNLGLTQFGVDPNRNYGGFWGGPGASAADSLPFGATAQDYRGPGPFSEPETRNIRALVSRRQVVTLITNHTFSNLVLRPPGLQAQGKPPDDRILTRLGNAMARENGYESQRGYELYDTSGTTEDWSYNATGGLGYTFEIGPTAFHPAFAGTVAEYRGTTPAAGAGGGNRAAYLTALRSTVNAKRHSVIRGSAPPGAVLTLYKRFKTPTSPVLDGSGEEGEVILLPEKLETSLKVGRSGRYVWHVNPSTRPLVDPGRKAPKRRRGKPSDPVEFSGDATGATPCADAESEDPSCFNDHGFRVPGGKGVDNGTATVRVSWPSPASDWDIKVFRDTDRDGSSEGETGALGSSASGPSNVEETTIARPGLRRGKYVVRVTNFAGLEPYEGRVTFGKTPKPPIPAGAERWILTCRASASGPVLARRKVRVDRGERVNVGLARACAR